MPFVEKDVSVDRMAAVEMIRRSHQQGVPVTVIADDVIVGFNQPALKKAVDKLNLEEAKTAYSGASPAKGFKLGAKVADASGLKTETGSSRREGAVVGTIHPGSPAEQAGLHEGDIIIALGSHLVRSVNDLQKALQALSDLPIAGLAGQAALTFEREGEIHQARLPLK